MHKDIQDVWHYRQLNVGILVYGLSETQFLHSTEFQRVTIRYKDQPVIFQAQGGHLLY
jgi:hypothetical protein